MPVKPVLCVIPARGGSKGLPGKNIKELMGHPLIAHSIMCAKMAPSLERIIVSTDDVEIASIARKYGADVPFMRPAELATDTSAMIRVLQHALTEMEKIGHIRYESLLLLDPTSPGRYPDDIEKAVRMAESDPDADGVIGVSEPEFNPLWHCVVEKDGLMSPLIPGASKFTRRQDVPRVFRINASLYLWKRDFILSEKAAKWIEEGKHLMLEIPEQRAIHIDHLEDFEKAKLFLKEKLVELPWIKK
ncbi:MAG TPA: acylneuraminate cytidylyltransferase family protein [Acidobacteriota bacterium]|nr:acylneuraminate cytidylyltransferase family protein [Acidobacteriota bacterium]HNT17608.1 acylneuraminate cytidylyltransferase family protein [Acidobacteriota bacterium]